MNQEYFVLYDYGQGGLWAIVQAESAARIRQRFPQLQVFEAPPPTLGGEAVAAIRAAGVQRIDAKPLHGWLGDLDT
jgi:hypothetical protein